MTLMENWLQSGEKIDAVVAHNDQMALGALQAIEEANPENDIIISSASTQSPTPSTPWPTAA